MMNADKPKYELFEILFLVSLTILLGLFFYAMRLALIPPFLVLILLFFLIPLRANPVVMRLIILIVVIFSFWFIRDTMDILAPFAIAFALAYLFDPLVTKLEKKRIPRLTSVSIIVVVSLGLFLLMLTLSIPRIINELRNLVSFIMEIPSHISEWLNSDGASMLGETREDVDKIQAWLDRELPHRMEKVSAYMVAKLVHFTKTLPTLFTKLLYLILTPFLFFYILKDFHKVRRWIKELLPIETSWVVREYVEKVDAIISGFFRGQLIVCTLVGILTTLLLLLFRVEYALLIGIMAGVLNIVPYVGLAITLFTGLVIGIASPNPLTTCLKIVVAVETIRVVESSVLAPRIVGDRVGLHPVWVMFSILIFAHFLGLVGLIIAVPLAASLKIFISVWMHSYRRKIWRRKKNDN